MSVAHDYAKYCLDVYNQAEFVPVRGQGSRLYDVSGREVIDFAGGIAVGALGHTHPQLVAALTEQAQQLWHVGNIMANVPAIELAQELIKASCFERVFFCNSGTEAVEAGLKLARRYARNRFGAHKHKIVSFHNSFHGRTLFAVATGGQAQYSADFAPLPAGIVHGTFNQTADLAELIDADTAVVIVEVIQAEGGVVVAEPEFLLALRHHCDRVGALLMYDEVQTGIGRTGKLFAYEHGPVQPDLISCAKALGCGFPIGALLVKQEFAEGFAKGSHGSTFGGNPLACSVALTALRLINNQELLAGVDWRNQIFRRELTRLNEEFALFDEVRGLGLLIGAQLNANYAHKAPQLMQLGFKYGVATLIASPQVSRFTPSLIISEAEISEGFARLRLAMAELVSTH